MRQRLRLRRSPLAYVGRALLVVLALTLAWYGVMTILLSVKVSPASIELISGYRSAYDYLAALQPSDITSETRLVIGLAGLAAFLAFGFLALKELPRPHLARSDLQLAEDERGSVRVRPRTIERVAEVVAENDTAVSRARARLENDEITLELGLRRAGEIAEALRRIQARAREELERHELPVSTVNVTFAHFDRSTRRELA